MRLIDLNCDLGESFGRYTLGLDEKTVGLVSSVNVACGWHAGDPVVMETTVTLAAACKTAVGAHTGFPDLLGFGRREMRLSLGEARTYTAYQLGALSAFTRRAGVPIRHLKPHGAMYNMAARDLTLAEAICRAALEFDPALIVLGPPGSELERAAARLGLRFAGEFFADRAYGDDGGLLPRDFPGAVICDPALAAERVADMAENGHVTAVGGARIPLRCDSVCVHGDNGSTLAAIAAIRETLERRGILIAPLKEVLDAREGGAL